MDKQKVFDLEKRTFGFSQQVRTFSKGLQMTTSNREDVIQLIRSSGSVGANYIEANEALSRKDFLMRLKICRKEAKESLYWLRLLDIAQDTDSEKMRSQLIQEARELVLILNSIIVKNDTRQLTPAETS